MLPAVLRSVSGAIALIITAIGALNAPNAQAQVSPHPGMLRYPDVSRSHIVFSYANDLWIVPREGGVASPLASPPGQEQMPRFSPDGKGVAFIGNYDGNRDLYTIGLEGGVPMRVTHHPANEVLCDWTPQGLLFFSNGIAGMARQQQLFTVGAQGGMPERLPIPYGTNGAISEDGTWLAYTPHTIDNRTWKRYRGGMATDIWLFNLNDKTSKKITDWEGTDTQPMWHGSTVYYLSDQGDEHRLNIWAYDTKSGGNKREQITRFKDYDVKWPAIGPGSAANSAGEIIFQNGSGLYLLDLGTKTSKPVNVTIPGDRPTIRPKSVNAAEFMQGAGISATGKRAAVQARGDIWTCPAEEGSPRNLTRTDDVAERDPSWSPDGQWIAYFSDATGEYELYIAQSDGRGQTRQLTHDGQAFRYSPIWSPDSKHILFTDKAGAMYLTTIEGGETKLIDTDPWANQPTVSWSHDSRWIAYDRTEDHNPLSSIWIYNVGNGEKKQVTSGYFSDSGPTFDRKGDYLYFRSNRHFDPTYGDVGADTTFIYQGTGRLLAVPLRAEIEFPYAPKSDEEKWDKEKKGEDADKDKDGEKSDEAKKDDAENGDKKENGKDEKKDDTTTKPAKDDGVSGSWSGSADTPDGVIQFTLSLTLNADKTVTGSLTSDVFSGAVSGTYDPDGKKLALSATLPNGATVTFDLTIDNNSLSGIAHSPDGDEVKVTATRTPPENGKNGKDGKKENDKDKPRKEVVIDFDGFEERAFILPPAAGQFGRLAVNDSNQLIYGRNAVGAGGPATGIYLFDLKDDKKEEKSVASGTTNFDISADGKKLLVIRGPKNASIQNAAAGATGKNLITDGMNVQIQPRDEWKQMFNEAWRLQRDFFYVPNMHGVDWPAIKEQYGRMLADCVTRDDVSYVISEMISELNVGHAYYSGGDVEDQPSVNVGLLGADFALENGAYRIKDIIGGGAWDAEARSPLTMAAEVAPLEKPAKDDKTERKRPVVKEGDYLLAVNGVPMDITQDPWVPFIDTVGKVVILTISDNPVKDETARDILVKPIGSEGDLRYRAWAENRRAYVEKKTDGKVGYIHVPDTGQNGQNNLYRGFYGQMSKPALIVDDRWNGGGQIPTRFIELLNRPVTNYWARRDGHDWPWPPDSMQGPKCMLINGLAGSGGDAFPYYFKQAKVGPTIGMRTWGGLVGISGNPGLIDGGNVTVPTFGFYKTNGNWGVEGHGVDPDVQVIDDPALMVDDGDPQLDKAIDMMMQAIATNPYVPPKRPAPPERAGMGVREEDK